ncbi:MAG: LamG domain-containing protein, partial [Candidatus Woesearchaeota archaeon]
SFQPEYDERTSLLYWESVPIHIISIENHSGTYQVQLKNNLRDNVILQELFFDDFLVWDNDVLLSSSQVQHIVVQGGFDVSDEVDIRLTYRIGEVIHQFVGEKPVRLSESSGPVSYVSFSSPTSQGYIMLSNITYTIFDTQNVSSFVDVNNSVIGWWRFENQLFRDESRYNNHGVGSYTSITDQGILSSALNMSDENEQYVRIPFDSSFHLLSQAQEMTLSTWVYLTPNTNSSIAEFQTIFSSGPIYSTETPFVFGYNSSSEELVLFIGNNSYALHANIELDEEEWYHLAVTFSPEVIRIYVNGNIEVFDTSHEQILPTILTSLYIGIDSPGSLNFFIGRIDDILFIARELHSVEISHLQKEQAPLTRSFSWQYSGNAFVQAFAQNSVGQIYTTGMREVIQ